MYAGIKLMLSQPERTRTFSPAHKQASNSFTTVQHQYHFSLSQFIPLVHKCLIFHPSLNCTLPHSLFHLLLIISFPLVSSTPTLPPSPFSLHLLCFHTWQQLPVAIQHRTLYTLSVITLGNV